jgi:MFS family permease
MQPITRFIAASGLTNLADGVAVVAWAWAASVLTRDALMIALVPVALRLPWFLFAIPAGIITDRVDRLRLIRAMDVLRALAFAVAALAIWAALPLDPAPDKGVTNAGLYALILLAALIVGGAEVFRDNAAQTVLPSLVPDAGLERANGRLWSVELVANALIGPAFGAFLIGLALPLPFALNVVAYAVAFLMLAGISGSFRPEQTAPRNWRRELGEGFDFLKRSPLLRTLALTTGGWNLVHQMVLIALVLHAQENLGLTAQVYGLVLAGGAVGGILGSLLAERIARALGPARTAQWMLATSAPAFVFMALAPGPWTLALVFVIFEFAGLVWNIVSVSTRQRLIPGHLLGRVNSLVRLLAWGMMPVGLVLSGLIVQAADGPLARGAALTMPFWAAAVGALILTVVAWKSLGRGFAADSHGPTHDKKFE